MSGRLLQSRAAGPWHVAPEVRFQRDGQCRFLQEL